jgi:hypothetical protein
MYKNVANIVCQNYYFIQNMIYLVVAKIKILQISQAYVLV